MQIDRTQAVFFDGIRHSAEIAGLAYSRLSETLTVLALGQHANERMPDGAVTAAFLDAWAFVDAVDRFRSLIRLAPGITATATTEGELTFSALTEPIRSLRNVADHLATRVDYVVAEEGTALGRLAVYPSS